jgi:hypothetical protein
MELSAGYPLDSRRFQWLASSLKRVLALNPAIARLSQGKIRGSNKKG